MDAYEAIQQGAGFYILIGAGYLRLSGEDRTGFLQRQSTNNLQRLTAGRGLATVLTSPTARILDVLYCWPGTEQVHVVTLPVVTLPVVTSPGQGSRTGRFLKSRIFFMDKVVIEDRSADTVQVELLGPQVELLLAKLGLPQPPEENQIAAVQLEGTGEGFLFAPGIALSPGYRLVIPAAAGELVTGLFQAAGAVSIDPDTWEVLRVEAGRPAAGAELTEEYTPLETGLESYVSNDKGCYTGQEIIARQITYDKVTQQLCGLRLEQPAQPGDRVWAAGKPAGVVTSSALSPRFGPIALAVLKRPSQQAGTAVRVGSQPETGAPASVTGLPFGEEAR